MSESTPTSTDAPAAAPTPPAAAGGDLVARAARYYRNTRYIIVVLLIGYGIWSIYDGFVSWPAANRRAVELRQERADAERAGNRDRVNQITADLGKITEHNHASVLLNQILGVLLPPAGLAMLFWSLRNSRGEFRLTPDDVLYAPGHPPVPIDAMTALDRRLWDRKGIAWVEYELDAGKSKGKIRLDDFIYERPPIDAMYDRILAKLDPEAFAAEKAKAAEKAAERA